MCFLVTLIEWIEWFGANGAEGNPEPQMCNLFIGCQRVVAAKILPHSRAHRRQARKSREEALSCIEWLA